MLRAMFQYYGYNSPRPIGNPIILSFSSKDKVIKWLREKNTKTGRFELVDYCIQPDIKKFDVDKVG